MSVFEETKGIDVQLADKNGVHYPAILDIDNDGISLDIYAESNEERYFQLDYTSLETLTCESFNKVFFLYGLQMESHFSSALKGDNGERGFMRIKLSAERVIIVKSCTYLDSKVNSIELSSEAIADWIGTTHTQAKIPTLSYEELTANRSKALKEFEVNIPEVGRLFLKYKWSQGGIDKFSVGTSFPPSLVLELEKEHSFEKALSFLDDLKRLLFFVVGAQFEVDVRFKLSFDMEGCLFECKSNPTYDDRHSILYPLLHNTIDSSYTRLPPFDVKAFAAYFALNSDTRNHWLKYQSYKQLENYEERYLGYFRILESLLYKQENFLAPELFDSCIDIFKVDLAKHFGVRNKKMESFLRYIKTQVNTKKYNVERNLIKQFKALPKEFKDIICFNQGNLKPIVDLRNDITHANKYSISERQKIENLTFLEALLLFEMFKKIGIDYALSLNAVIRIPRFVYIRSHSASM
ncbi:conserved hypothetical protein [Vibrio chagasii]|nr:conserved hypothetical protein [Vibrio chagasii]CAH6961039.1 conserved hypothetical protein [Vibrio chagasii]CAH7004427.1 conserved hypothetical protein [Vibrio chagasii]CAH7034313.1 conserved hypothetical protein [Vibrio chagasii]CAH7199660.1 conserved hypothetical protein [Vibrio chagasii]